MCWQLDRAVGHGGCCVTCVTVSQWTVAKVADVFLQLACGVKHLHACGVLHRDLKTDNALISSKDPLVVKWADFGCSVKLDDSDSPYGSSTYCIAALQGDVCCCCVSSVCLCMENRGLYVHGADSAHGLAGT